MSGRLASFKGPSIPLSPDSSPSGRRKYSNNRGAIAGNKEGATLAPDFHGRELESTFHRKIRVLLLEIRSICRLWSDIVLHDGLKAARTLVDTRTELDNALAALPPGEDPKYRIAGPKIRIMDKQIHDLDDVLTKFVSRKLLDRLSSAVDKMELVLFEAHRTKGWQWVEEPLWTSWSLRKFVTKMPQIVRAYHRSCHMHTGIVETLRPHSVSFETSRQEINRWVAQPYLEETSWDVEWEDLCQVEVDRWQE